MRLSQEFLRRRCRLEQAVPAQIRTDAVEVTFQGVAPGIYAVQAWQDDNDSNLPRSASFLGPPRFRDAVFSIGGDADIPISLRLRSLKG